MKCGLKSTTTFPKTTIAIFPTPVPTFHLAAVWRNTHSGTVNTQSTMSYRMPYPVPCLGFFVIAVGGFLMARCFLTTKAEANRMQTYFLLNQIKAVAASPFLPGSKPELIQLLKRSNIDWNSCKLTSEEVLDSWGTPFHLDFGGIPDRFEMRSAGADKKLDTDDDILRMIEPTKPTP